MIRHLLILLILAATNFSTKSQWIQENGIYTTIDISVYGINSRHASGIGSNNSELYVTTNKGFYRNTSALSIWEKLSYTPDMDAWIIKGDSLIFSGSIGTSPNKVSGLVYHDLKDTTSSGVSLGFGANTILSTDTNLIAGSDYIGCRKSVGFSSQWKYINNGLPRDSFWEPMGGNQWIYYTHVYSLNLKDKYLYAGTHRGVYKTHIDTLSWRQLKNGIPATNIQLVYCSKNLLLAAVSGNLYKSNDNGNSWSLSFTSGSNITLLYSFMDTILFTSKTDGIMYSIDQGVKWNSMNKGLQNLKVTSLNYTDGILTCGNNMGFYYYDGTEWIQNNNGLDNRQLIGTQMVMPPTNSLFAKYGNNIYRKYPSGTWDTLIRPKIDGHPELSTTINSMLSFHDTLVVTFTSPQSGEWYSGINYSLDTGKTWIVMNNPTESKKIYELYKDRYNMYLVAQDKLYFSGDFANTWIEINCASCCLAISSFVVHNSNPYIINTCGADQIQKNIKDNIWQRAGTEPQQSNFEHLVSWNNKLFTHSPNKGLYLSENDGLSWTLINDFIRTPYNMNVSAQTDKILIIGGDHDGLYYSQDGIDWITLNDGLINHSVRSMNIYQDTLYIGTYGSGILKRSLNDLSITGTTNKGEQLKIQIYPNPASREVHISMENEEEYFLNFYDLNGKNLFADLFYGNRTIDLSDFPKGMIILKISSKQGNLFYKLLVE